jgi:hypothetical protein
MRTLQKILPEQIKSREAAFKEWLQVAKDELQWKQIIQNYFESCKTIEQEESPNSKTSGDTSMDKETNL